MFTLRRLPRNWIASPAAKQPKQSINRFAGEARIVILAEQELALAFADLALQNFNQHHGLAAKSKIFPVRHGVSGPMHGSGGIFHVQILRTRRQPLQREINTSPESDIAQVHPREVVAAEIVADSPGHGPLFGWHRAVEDSLAQASGEGAVDQLDRKAEPVPQVNVPERATLKPGESARAERQPGSVERAVNVMRHLAAFAERCAPGPDLAETAAYQARPGN